MTQGFGGRSTTPMPLLDEGDQLCASLLGIPAELRNIIYTLVLVDGDPVVWDTKANCNIPALLCTCRQIRKEASGIYYTANLFHVNATDLDFTLCFRLCSQANAITMSNVKDQTLRAEVYGTVGTGSWPSVLKACKAVHQTRGRGHPKILYRLDSSIGWRCSSRALELTSRLYDAPWSQVEAALEVFRLSAREESWIWS